MKRIIKGLVKETAKKRPKKTKSQKDYKALSKRFAKEQLAKKGTTGPKEAPFRGMSVDDIAKRFSTKQLKNIKDAFKRGELGDKEYQSQLNRINKAIGKHERRKVREQRESAGRPTEREKFYIGNREFLRYEDEPVDFRKGGMKKKKKSPKPKVKLLFGLKK